MRSRSFLVLVVVFLICETLVAQRLDRIRGPKSQGQDPVEGQDHDEGQGPVKVEILDIGQDLVKGQDPVKGQDVVKGQDPVKGQDLVKSQDPVTAELPDIGQDVVKGHEPVEGQDPINAQIPDKVQDPIKAQPAVQGLLFLSKRGRCPWILLRCPLANPSNKCWRDYDCPGVKKCCEGFCGKDCLYPK
ncbi:sodium/potassium ATPase inhibitor SPAI-2 isoform X2 [Phacochoerus africanus]|uniref:sodium/potassium ATPase inhibitor SPAI-2 isoform X2 n=1 Tax=Phacochoerus africanus TaxID=41426 RepID=UPI001FDA1524|nr:sodium/potassium ATPase inhibitor SPAI-2 isoform X2 [Phacochoerus africanus]